MELYMMYELRSITVPASINQILSLPCYFDDMYFILNAYHTHCVQMPPWTSWWTQQDETTHAADAWISSDSWKNNKQQTSMHHQTLLLNNHFVQSLPTHIVIVYIFIYPLSLSFIYIYIYILSLSFPCSLVMIHLFVYALLLYLFFTLWNKHCMYLIINHSKQVFVFNFCLRYL